MIDVCLILEGTYPYVAGGVSTWVHQLISAMHEIRFGIVYIAPHSDPTRRIKYKIPPNVIYLKEINLHDYNMESTRRQKPNANDYKIVENFYSDLPSSRYTYFKEFTRLFRGDTACFDTATVFDSQQIWQILIKLHNSIGEDISFLDFFWTWRGTHLPMMQILTAEMPRAKIYHAISTGYAGLLGAIARCEYESKFFLTEHGIYTHERSLEISQADWIYEREKSNFRAEHEMSFFKRWWIEMFRHMSLITYKFSDQIFTLYEGNKLRQMLEGASSDKISIIPNGIPIREFSAIQPTKKPSPQIALIGRVVPIKDIKTFIQAAKIVLAKIPKAQFYIMGPTDEEEDYFEECRSFMDSLGLEHNVTFTGRVNLKDHLGNIDIVVLTSVSEAQPYVILEANVLGIPVVATDVGACSEMLNGRDAEDKLIGPSGLLTRVAAPGETADAILKLIEDKEMAHEFGESGKQRVREYYDQDDLLSKYLNVYEQNM